ncbi:Hypothetical_protein [Hexamita inflata]|uniref:Hypothetical_protein n=1 Tax=Hexamita inflata TaxID=28002 RepID=A0AA86RD92_9EUKA|nr:Hypothetical protein HINF_LOCUS61872 [Hexamita inflata]
MEFVEAARALDQARPGFVVGRFWRTGRDALLGVSVRGVEDVHAGAGRAAVQVGSVVGVRAGLAPFHAHGVFQKREVGRAGAEALLAHRNHRRRARIYALARVAVGGIRDEERRARVLAHPHRGLERIRGFRTLGAAEACVGIRQVAGAGRETLLGVRVGGVQHVEDARILADERLLAGNDGIRRRRASFYARPCVRVGSGVRALLDTGISSQDHNWILSRTL